MSVAGFSCSTGKTLVCEYSYNCHFSNVAALDISLPQTPKHEAPLTGQAEYHCSD